MLGVKGKSRNSTANPLELGRESIRSFGKHTVKKVGEETQINAKTFLEQLLGVNLKKDTQTTSDNGNASETQKSTKNDAVEVFSFLKHQDTTPDRAKIYADRAPRPHIEAANDYHQDIAKSREKASKGELRDIQRNIEQIKIELSKLVASSHVLKLEFANVTVEQSITNVGNYHLNFFDWMLTVIRAAREKIEDSGAWLGAIKNKGAKKSYWGMFKKHGTTFGLSGERAVATQVG
ncbi:MAG TPA: DUF5660 family protein [Candidatus Sulfotelmatobacter sp.]|jgi:hypothetical protein|nr:DUF5660 family protein [Candidatus Sulfotelmatobacter sp.]